MTDSPAKRTQIIEAARALFGQKRFDEVSVPEIVGRAGVAQGTFYRYFTSKNALADALTQEFGRAVIQAIQPLIQAETPFTEQLEPILHRALQTAHEFEDILGFINIDALMFAESRTGEQQRSPVLDLLEATIKRDQQRGLIRAQVDPQIAARMVDACLNRMAKDCVLEPRGLETAHYLRQTVAFLKSALAM
jgi:AcrR family transcriptional regulator